MTAVPVRAFRRLWAARMLGAGATAVLGQLAVDMPVGYFGGTVQMTGFGAMFVAVTSLAVVAAGAVFLIGHRVARGLAGAVLLLNLLLFLPPLAVDPVVAGAVVLWHVYLLARLLFPMGVRVRPLQSFDGPAGARLERWLHLNRLAVQHLLAVAVVLIVAVAGFRVGEHAPALAACLVVGLLSVAASARFLRLAVLAGSRLLLGLLIPLALAAASAFKPDLALAWLAVYQVGVLAVLLGRTSTLADLTGHFQRRPALLVVVSFGVLIALGTLFLSFPAASAGEGSVAPVDALFTATSAVCVTGLIVLDTPGDFSVFGQGVILALIQMGGLNIMVLYAFSALLLGRGLGLRGERALGEALDLSVARTTREIVVFIVAAALLIEGIGGGLLTAAYLVRGEGLAEAAWKGVFHAVSAFCNAGFSLHPDSLVGFQQQPLVLGVVMVLIVCGGLGFNTLATAWSVLRGRRGAVSVHVKVVLVVTAAMVFFGALWFGAAEWSRSLAGLSSLDKVVNALFQSVTLRTAGFNTVDPGLFHGATVLMAMAWMFIGASPGGTGGGIKTTTAAVLLGAIPAITRGRTRVVLFSRAVPLDVVYRAAAITVLAASVGFAGSAFLVATQDGRLDALVFEALSALGTVGLSLGATATLDALGKAALIVVMFVGRLGPLTLVLLLGRAVAGRIGYPDARLMVG